MKLLSSRGRTSLRKAQRAWLAAMNATCGMGKEAEIIDEGASTCFTTEVRKRVAQLSKL
jgi:uncharacterized protein YecT (DUF1311 family)